MKRSSSLVPGFLLPLFCAGGVALFGLLPVRAAGLAPATVRYTAEGAVATALFELPQIRRTADGLLDLTLTNTLAAEQGGQPVLPEAVVAVALPAGAQLADCVVTPSEGVAISLDGIVRHGQLPASYSMEPGEPVGPDPEIYAMDLPYPLTVTSGWSVEQRGQQRVVNVRLNPVQYVPAYGVVLVNQRVEIAVTWRTPTAIGAGGGTRKVEASDARVQASAVLAITGRVDYVVITSPDLLVGAEPYSFQALCAARTRGGLIATTVTTDWIYANYAGNRPDGRVDNPTRIRNFIRDAYENWGTRFVLLGGTAARVPTRSLYGRVLTGGGPMVDSIASDLYYGCLDGTFDANANGVYGEATDGEGGQDVDLVAEVYVGRFPVNTPDEVAWMVRKTLAYEQATPEQLRKISHVGEWLGFGGVSDYATAAMDQLRLGGSYDGYATRGFANAVQADRFDLTDDLYDAPGYTWGNGEVLRRFQSGYHVFNHLGHGNWGYCFKLNTGGSSSDRAAIASLTNRSYFLAYSQACEAGRFDDHTDCLAETLVTVSNGPAALILNTRDGWGLGSSTDGPSQRYHRYFWHELLGGGSYRLGEANQKSKEDVRYYVNYYNGAMRWCYYELTLFGDPALPFGASISPVPPTITHVPLHNQLATDVAYRVVCTFGPTGLYEPDSAEMVWTSTLLPDQVNTTRFTQVAGTTYEALLPAAPCGATFSYAIHLATRAGLSVVAPTSGVYRFAVTPVFSLQVAGDPQPLGAVSPDYGVSQIASGNWIQASAPLRVTVSPGYGWRSAGWSGSGSVPASGASNDVAFWMTGPSQLVWHWLEQYALSQHTSPEGLFATNLWCDAGGRAESVVAADQAVLGGTNCQFIGWYLDGQRLPTVGRATNQLSQILMDRQREALAHYVPAALDADADGVPDWWELYYYGDTARGAEDDTDHDGAGLLLEYLAQTDPLDPNSRPLPPLITVTPLSPVQTAPPPYDVSVQIAGTAPLVVTQLVWQRNQEAVQSSPLVRVAGDTQAYRGALTGAAASGDQFTYWVQATGRDGLSAQSAVYTTHLHYAVMALAPPCSRGYVPGAGGVVTDQLAVANSGTAALSWQVQAGFGEYADALPLGWNLAAVGTPWTWSTARSLSAPASLRAAILSSYVPSGRSQHAAMTTPPLRLGTNALLAFSYWINSELDETRPGYCWDGAVVEISTDGGGSYQALSGPYTHAISGWSASPWADGTPCFAGAGEGWHEASFDLSAFADSDVILRFHYGADDNTDREGWYVDNVRVAPVASGMVAGCSLSPAAGLVVPGDLATVALQLDTASFPQRRVRLPLLVRGSDPVTPVSWYDLSVDSRYYPCTLTIVGTNGADIVSADAISSAQGTDFGARLAGSTGQTHVLRAANRSDDTLSISAVATTGTGADSFALRDLPVTLAPHTTNSFAVVFTPQAGLQEAQFVISHSGVIAPFVLRVAGVGIGGCIRFSTQEVACTTTYQGAAPALQAVGLANVGGRAFVFTNRVSYGAGASGWLRTLPDTGQVAGGAVCLLTNCVDPGGLPVGSYVATNQIFSVEATNSPQAYVVRLTVTKAEQNIQFGQAGTHSVTDRVDLAASASSGLPVSLTVADGPASITDGGVLLFHGAGAVCVHATQAGDSNWLPTEATNRLTVVGVITNVMPACGSIYGGAPVTICGLWLGNGTDITQVTLCDMPATILSQSVHTVSVLAGVSPVSTTAAVCVTSDGFGQVCLVGGFTYQPVPPPPTAFPALAISTNRFTACWSAAASATNYVLEVSPVSSFEERLASYQSRSVGNVTACLVTGLVDRTTYYYRVRAVNAHGCSTNSNTLAVPTGANVPYLLREAPTGVVSVASVDAIGLPQLIHGTNLNYAILSNSQSGLVTAAVSGTNLTLRYTSTPTGGTAQIIVRATDATGYFLDVVVTVVLAPAPCLVLDPVVFNRQTGLYEQSALVSNVSPTLAAQAVTLTVTNLSGTYRLYNATGRDLAGNPEIRWTGQLPPRTAMRFLLEYYSAMRGTPPTAMVSASLSLAAPIQAAVGAAQAIAGLHPLAGQSLLIEFPAIPGRLYYVQYTDALSNAWRTVYPGIEAPVNRVQWIDTGPPGTICLPGLAPARFYRVIEATP